MRDIHAQYAARARYPLIRPVLRMRVALATGALILSSLWMASTMARAPITQVAPGMHPLTALIAALLALSLLTSRPMRPSSVPADVFALAAMTLAGARLLEWAMPSFGAPLSELLGWWFAVPDGIVTGVNTALMLFFLSAVMALRRQADWVISLVFFPAAFIGMVAATSYAYGSLDGHGDMSLISLAVLTMLGAAVIAQFACRRVLRVYVSGTVPGHLARIYVAFGIVLPWVAGAVLSRLGVVEWTDLSRDAYLITTFLSFMWLMSLFSALAHEATDFQRRSAARQLANGVVRDSLTGLLNRRGAAWQFSQLWDRRRRMDGARMVVMMLDVDLFKRVNDRFGHDRGDCVLQEFARVLSDGLSSNDILCRWGGEEFLIVADGLTLEQGAELADQLRKSVAAHDFGDGLRVSASIGCSDVDPSEPEIDAAIRRADQALLRAKERCRNCVMVETCPVPTIGYGGLIAGS